MQRSAAATYLVFMFVVPLHAAEISPQPDGTLRVVGRTYRAAVDPQGNLRSLTVRDAELVERSQWRREGGAANDDVPPAKVVVQNCAVAVTFGRAHVRWNFDDTGIDVETEGAALEYLPGAAVTTFLLADGSVHPASAFVGDVARVLAGRTALAIDLPFHHTGGRLWPSLLVRGGKAETPLNYRIECGVSVKPVDLVAIDSFSVRGHDPRRTPFLAAGEQPRFDLAVTNMNAEDAAAELRLTILDHPVKGFTVFDRRAPFRIAGGETKTVSVTAAIEKPGLYWIDAALYDGEKKLRGARLGLAYDATRYRPPLTRPCDFRSFWEAKLDELRRIPFAEKLSESRERSNERFVHYDLELTVENGQRLTTFLRVPRAPGPHDAEVISHWGSTPLEKVLADVVKLEQQPVGAGMWQRGDDRIRVGAPQPEDSTYTRWNGRDDNNILDTYLRNVRMLDYLRSRNDVRRIWVFGASRSGSGMLVAAALDARKIAAINVHVPTSCGLSWEEKPYQGWGRPPATNPEGLQIAAYFDPVNFAPEITVPLILDGGIFDTLSPAPGILALYNWAERSPFKRVAIELGGHGYFPPDNRQQFERELAEFLDPSDNRTGN